MPLGSAVISTIDIDFTRAQGVNSQGKITFTPPRIPVGSTMLSGRGVLVEVEDGVGAINLARLPAGTYQVREEIDGEPPYEFSFSLPLDSPAVVQYEQIAEVEPAPVVYTTVKSVNGVLPNVVTGNVAITAEAGPHTHPTSQVTGLDAALGGKVNSSVVDAAGDLVVGVAADAVGRLPIGANGKLLGVASGALAWVNRGLSFRRTTGAITGVGSTFLAGEDGPWEVCPTIWRPPSGPAVVGQVVDLLVSSIVGATSADGVGNPGGAGAEIDMAAINNTNPAAPVILRCLSSGTNIPLANGDGGLYLWSSSKRLPAVIEWVVEAGDLVGGMITLALLYRNTANGGSTQGLRIGHTSLWPSRVAMRNNGIPSE